jgi:hypothetical protein
MIPDRARGKQNRRHTVKAEVAPIVTWGVALADDITPNADA